MSTKIKRLYEEFGQSLWYDDIARELLESGAIKALVDSGVRGLTSNPSIFTSAIAGGTAYDGQIQQLAAQKKSPEEIYESLAVQDIQAAADILRPIFDSSGGADGFVSLEVSPLLAYDTAKTMAEAARLWQWVNRPNLMIKIPATEEGLPAVTETIAAGINVNVTLIFSLNMYRRVIDAYVAGLQQRADAGKPINTLSSVASFFVSRLDTLIDKLLEEKIAAGLTDQLQAELESLKGKAAVASAKLAYQVFKQACDEPRYRTLTEKGARNQRPLWASTSTKNPAYPDTLYVDTLIGSETVNTAPPNTIEAFVDHGVLDATLEQGLDQARDVMERLDKAGIDIHAVTDRLLDEGVDKFADAFRSLLGAIEQKLPG
nr:transaldolase [Anaerolineae bacterium]